MQAIWLIGLEQVLANMIICDKVYLTGNLVVIKSITDIHIFY